jgi:predicted nucleotidyltransferase
MAADTSIKDDPTLARFRAALAEVYGARLERIVLYGSRARGDARPDSDYDVAVFLRDMDDRGRELYRLAVSAPKCSIAAGCHQCPSLSCRRLSRPHAPHV